MKISELLGVSSEVQRKRIGEQPMVSLQKTIETPEFIAGKAICIIGNFAGFDRPGFPIREFIYDVESKLWTVIDWDLENGFKQSFETHFDSEELKKEFCSVMQFIGYLLDQE